MLVVDDLAVDAALVYRQRALIVAVGEVKQLTDHFVHDIIIIFNGAALIL